MGIHIVIECMSLHDNSKALSSTLSQLYTSIFFFLSFLFTFHVTNAATHFRRLFLKKKLNNFYWRYNSISKQIGKILVQNRKDLLKMQRRVCFII